MSSTRESNENEDEDLLTAINLNNKNLVLSIIRSGGKDLNELDHSFQQTYYNYKSGLRHILAMKDSDITIAAMLHNPRITISSDIIYELVKSDVTTASDIMPLIAAKIRDNNPLFTIDSLTSTIQLAIDNHRSSTFPYTGKNARKFENSIYAAASDDKISELLLLKKLILNINSNTPIFALKVLIIQDVYNNQGRAYRGSLGVVEQTWPLLFKVQSGNLWKHSDSF